MIRTNTGTAGKSGLLILIGVITILAGEVPHQNPASQSKTFVGAVEPFLDIERTAEAGKALARDSKDDLRIQQLSAKIPGEPTFVDRETLDLMREVAQTRSADAATVLVKCLAFNFNPVNQDEDKSVEMMIPAIQLLRDFFGESASTYLYKEGVVTDKKWFRERIVLAIRSILPEQAVQHLKDKTMSEAGLYPNAVMLYQSLTTENLDLQLNAPTDKRLAEVDKSIEAIQKKNKQKRPR